VREWLHEEELSYVDVELSFSEPILTSDHVKNSELSKIGSDVYTKRSSSPNEDSSRKNFMIKTDSVGQRKILKELAKQVE
jgi:hypothetical protein